MISSFIKVKDSKLTVPDHVTVFNQSERFHSGLE